MSYNIDSDSFHGTKKGMRRKTVSKRRAYEYTPRQFDKELSQIYNNVVLNKAVTETAWTAGKANGMYPSNSTWKASHTQPVFQDIDHSKLVPLLVKTIQELEARITTLEG